MTPSLVNYVDRVVSRPTPDCGGKSHLSARLLRLLQVAEDNAAVDPDHARLTSQLSV